MLDRFRCVRHTNDSLLHLQRGLLTDRVEMMRNERSVRHYTVLLSSLVLVSVVTTANALLLCDLPTPSLVIDLLALQKKVTGCASRDPNSKKRLAWKPPSIQAQDNQRVPSNILLDPMPLDGFSWFDTTTTNMNAEESVMSSLWTTEGICYLHTRVTRAREDCNPDEDPDTFLAEVDLLQKHMQPVDLSEPQKKMEPPTLVLGLNNHHVISYYWARSAGAGAAMEAPGIVYNPQGGQLRWKSRTRTDDNTNDGKRSEWVNFLRVGDAVQLVPHPSSVPDVLSAVCLAGRIYGISSQGRPLGSEPGVICHWQLQKS